MKNLYPIYHLEDFTPLLFDTHVQKSTRNLHSHNFWEISYVVKGSIHHYINDFHESLTRGAFFLIRPNDLHSFEDIHDDYVLHRDLLFSEELFREICEHVRQGLYEELLVYDLPPHIPMTEEVQNNLEERLLKFSMIDNSETVLKLALGKSFGAFLLSLYLEYNYFKEEKYSTGFNNLLSLLRTSEIIEGGIPVFMQKTGYSHGHLCRIFREHTGDTLLAKLTEYRMNQAASLLKNTNFSLMDIASKVGYESYNHFISVFQKYYKMTPYRYKKTLENYEKNKQPKEKQKARDLLNRAPKSK